MTKDGGPAFPGWEIQRFGDGIKAAVSGMSLRDWFAGQAVAAVSAQALASLGEDAATINIAERCIAEAAYAIADAMLAERVKKKEGE